MQFIDVMVSGGLFTVTLDFGSVFTGDARWLEIGARPGGTVEPFTVLTPRQALTPTPNAVFSQTVPWTGVSGKPADLVPPGAVLFFDLTACPAGWTPLAEAQGRTIVGLHPGGTLKQGVPEIGTPGLADRSRASARTPSPGATAFRSSRKSPPSSAARGCIPRSTASRHHDAQARAPGAEVLRG